jgi:hypothetical protein
VSESKPVRKYQPVTDADLARAREDLVFRQRMLAENLDWLLIELNRLRSTVAAIDEPRAGQLCEGARLAVELADRLHSLARSTGSAEH